MSHATNGGPAYPAPIQSTIATHHTGMTLRDHFAGLAMQGWMSLEGSVDHRFMAETCYLIADAMLEARK